MTKLRYSMILLVLLTGCYSAPPREQPAPVEEREVEVRVREPARKESAGVQVYPLENPAVKQLLVSAQGAEEIGDWDRAAALLERALRIQSRNPEILQRLAELHIQRSDFSQALNFASRSYDIGPRVGQICARNWRTISVAREKLGELEQSKLAEQRAARCMQTKPTGY